MLAQRKSISTSLSVPADKRFLDMARDYVWKLARTAGLSDDESRRLELASEEAFVNILEHAYPDGTPGEIFLKGYIGETELILSIRDEGVPFDQSPEDYPPPITGDPEMLEHGLGFRLIRSAVDEAHFENLGRQGKVLHLVKHLSKDFEPKQDQMTKKVEIAPQQQYEVRPMHFEEAIQVARLFWEAYGYSYKNEDFYRPEGLVHLVGSGRVISYVAVAENGEVIGHIGLLRPEPVPMAEEALIVVAPAHRGRKIMEMLHEAIHNKAVDMGLQGVCIDPVTSHPISQKKIIQLGGRPCAIDLAACPPRVFKGLVSEEKPQRESYLHCFEHISPPPTVFIHVPQHHQAMVSQIYQEMEQQHSFGNPAPAESPGDYQIDFDKTLMKGVLRVIIADQRQWPEILRAADDLAEFAGAEVVDLDLPVAQPASVLLCELAEEAGFFFSGIRPSEAPDGDYLRLQRLHVPLDMSKLSIFSDFGKEIFDYVAANRSKAPKM